MRPFPRDERMRRTSEHSARPSNASGGFVAMQKKYYKISDIILRRAASMKNKEHGLDHWSMPRATDSRETSVNRF